MVNLTPIQRVVVLTNSTKQFVKLLKSVYLEYSVKSECILRQICKFLTLLTLVSNGHRKPQGTVGSLWKQCVVLQLQRLNWTTLNLPQLIPSSLTLPKDIATECMFSSLSLYHYIACVLRKPAGCQSASKKSMAQWRWLWVCASTGWNISSWGGSLPACPTKCFLLV